MKEMPEEFVTIRCVGAGHSPSLGDVVDDDRIGLA